MCRIRRSDKRIDCGIICHRNLCQNITGTDQTGTHRQTHDTFEHCKPAHTIPSLHCRIELAFLPLYFYKYIDDKRKKKDGGSVFPKMRAVIAVLPTTAFVTLAWP